MQTHHLPPKVYQSIPKEIRALICQRNILSSEDPKQYDDLLRVLIETCQPQDALQWLQIKDLQDLIWEKARLKRIKPGIIEIRQKDALESLLTAMHHTHINHAQAKDDAIEWYLDPDAKKEIQKRLAQFNLTQNSIDALAVVQCVNTLVAVEKMQMSIDARQFAISAQLVEQKVLQLQLNNQNGEVQQEVPQKLTHTAPQGAVS